MPEPTFRVRGKIFRNSDATLRHAIGTLPEAASKPQIKLDYRQNPVDQFEEYLRGTSKTINDHFAPNMNELQLARISALKPGQTMKDLPEQLQHESFRKRANRRVMDGTPSEKRGGSPSGLKRLLYNEPSLTITGAATREFIHPEQNRPLSIREAARIQTFPDDFIFCGNSSNKIQQIGNAIPPLLARIFAEHIKDDHGFNFGSHQEGELIGYLLTKAEAMSPALARTEKLLYSIRNLKIHQGELF
jgi:DNA (cytosine-5)-methyltransferase 1